MEFDHPFAAYVRILGRGRKLSRSLTLDEAEDAMAMILRGEVLPEQLGAFMMLLRVKEETPEEIAGFVRAARASFVLPDPLPQVDLDWSSYAGKRRQLPWFLLSALLLSQVGVRLFMHGTEGHTQGRLYTREVLEALGLPIARSLAEAGAHIEVRNFAYLPLQHLSVKLHQIIELRPILGLRSPVHTVARMLNPLDAPCLLQGIFHRGYMETHQVAAQLLGEKHMAAFRGEGGEIECRPNKSFEVRSVHDGILGSEVWPSMLPQIAQPVDEDMAIERLMSLWRGDTEDDYATAAITGTLAVALKALGRAEDIARAHDMAATMWRARDKARLAA
jgi:anthranilate phosphoribosyltransferase